MTSSNWIWESMPRVGFATSLVRKKAKPSMGNSLFHQMTAVKKEYWRSRMTAWRSGQNIGHWMSEHLQI
jgi:hypothetical protein